MARPPLLLSQHLKRCKEVFRHIDMTAGDRCWVWKGGTNAAGRPYFRIGGRIQPAYQIVLFLKTGEEPNGRLVRHKCDNPLCCNPGHLEWGTHEENMEDMKSRERHGVPRTVLRAWNKLRDEGRTFEQIAELYGVNPDTVRKGVERWKSGQSSKSSSKSS